MAGTSGDPKLLNILENTFSREGTQRAGPGSRPGSGPGAGHGMSHGTDQHEEGIRELPEEIQNAIAVLNELKAGLKASENSGTKDTNSADESPANKPPPLAVQLAIVDSLLIMFETPKTLEEKKKRAEKMNTSTKAIEGLEEEGMMAAIDFMEGICKEDVFSAAVYQHMRSHFCKSHDDVVKEWDAALAKDDNIPFKDKIMLQLDDQIVCTGITCKQCSNVINTPDKCGVCKEPVCRSCTWSFFFKTFLKRQDHLSLARDYYDNDPNIPFLIKMVSFFQVRKTAMLPIIKKEKIVTDFWTEIAKLKDPAIFPCAFCRSSLYLHGDGYIEKEIAKFQVMYPRVLHLMTSLKQNILKDKPDEYNRLTKQLQDLKVIFNESLEKLTTLYDDFKLEYEESKKAYDRIRSDYAKISRKLRENVNDLKIIKENYNLKINELNEVGETGLNSLESRVWETRLPAFHDDPNVIEFLTSPVSNWQSYAGDHLVTFSDVLNKNVLDYSSNPFNFAFPELKFHDLQIRLRVDYDLSGIATSVLELVNAEVSNDARTPEVDKEFIEFVTKVTQFFNRKEQNIQVVARKVRRALALDCVFNERALSKWAANYSRCLVVYINDKDMTLTELLKLRGFFAAVLLLNKYTNVELSLEVRKNNFKPIHTLGEYNPLDDWAEEYGNQTVVPGPRRSSDALTELALKDFLLGKCGVFGENLRDLKDSMISLYGLMTRDNFKEYMERFYKNTKMNYNSIDVMFDIAILHRAILPPENKPPMDLLERLLHAFDVTVRSYRHTVYHFDSIKVAAGVSGADGSAIEETFKAITNGFRGSTNKNKSCVFDLALAIIRMRTNCSGRLVSFQRLLMDLQIPADQCDPVNTEAQDEFLSACQHLKVYFEQTGRAVETPSNLLLPEGASSSGPPENTRRNPGNAVTNALRRVLPVTRPPWRGGYDTPRVLGVSGRGGDPGGGSGLSATAAILASLAVVAASAFAGAIKNAS
jgi:hypothetical protein